MADVPVCTDCHRYARGVLEMHPIHRLNAIEAGLNALVAAAGGYLPEPRMGLVDTLAPCGCCGSVIVGPRFILNFRNVS